MQTAFKIIAWSISSLIIIVMIGVSIALWLLFTPERITPIVQGELDKMLLCESKVDRVELTFFSTFPDFVLHLHGLTLFNPMDGAPSDTLLSASSACATIDIQEFVRHNAVVIREVLLEDAKVLAFIDADGKANFDIMPPTEDLDTADFELPFSRLDVEKIKMSNTRIAYYDLPMKLQADLKGVKALMTLRGENALLAGNINLQSNSIELVYDSISYLDNVPARISTPFSFEINRFLLQLPDAEIMLNGLPFDFSLLVENNAISGDLLLDIAFASQAYLPIKPALDMVPEDFAELLQGINLDGDAILSGTLAGVVNELSLPHLVLNIELEKTSLVYEGLPYALRDMKAKATIVMDMNKEDNWHIIVDDFDARAMNSHIKGSAKVDDLMGDMRFNLRANGVLNLADAAPMMPDDIKMDLKGIARGSVNMQFRFSHIMDLAFDKMVMDGNFAVAGFHLLYDTISAVAPAADLAFKLPSPSNSMANFAQLHLKAGRLDIAQGEAVSAFITGVNLRAALSNLMDSTQAKLVDLDGFAESFKSQLGDDYFESGTIRLVAEVVEDPSATDPSLAWIPKGFVKMSDGLARLSDLEPDLIIPAIEFDFSPEGMVINDSRLLIGFSDFKLTGTLSNLDEYLNSTGLLKGDFDFVSSTTDVNYLMKLVDGFGYDDSLNTDAVSGATMPSTGPFMVPKGVDVSLNVHIDEAFLANDVLSNVRGAITVKDGTLGLESVLFTASAARMQLNALYQSSRRNHLFLGLDFHLTDIEIEELLMMIPDIDTMMPMLRSFKGRGEFHLAAQTHLDSTYSFKPSTIRGVASISGTDLVLMDGETFSEIAKTLMFSKKAENRVDSLAAEFTIFQTEVDIYPFQIVMDRYKAVVAGKHNLDMNFKYHISLTESPLPFQLGIDVSGTLDDLKYRPVAPRYGRLYRPAQRREIDRRQLEIIQMIRETLRSGATL